MSKNDLYKSFSPKLLYVTDDNGEVLESKNVIDKLSCDIRMITDLTEWTLQNDKNLLPNLDEYLKHNGSAPNNTIGRLLNIKLPPEFKKNHKGNSRFEFIYQDRVIREARSWLERTKAKEGTNSKYVSSGWKRTASKEIPTDLIPKMSLSAVDTQYAKIINNPWSDNFIVLHMIISGAWYNLIFKFDKERFKDAYKVTLPDIRINENDEVVFNFSAAYEYQYAAFSENYIVGIDVGIKQYATVSVIEQNTNKIVHTTTLSPRVHSLYNSIRASNRQIAALQHKNRKWEASLHRQKNVNKKKDLAILAGQEVADISYKYGNAVVIVEDLSWVSNTMQNGRWNRAELIKWVQFFTELNGGRVLTTNAAYTSQVCSNCGAPGHNNSKTRVFSCPSCGYSEDRDVNASRNIAIKGERSVAKSIATRKKSKRFVRKAKRRTIIPTKNLKYPGRDKTKKRPTPKRPKQVCHKIKVVKNSGSPTSINDSKVVGDVNIKHTINRTPKKQPDFLLNKLQEYNLC